MNAPRPLLLLAVLSSTMQAAADCSLCFDGKSITKPDHVLDLTNPVKIKTCQDLVDVLFFVDESSDICASAKSVGTLCGCPNLPSDACTICDGNMTRPLQSLDGLVDLGDVDFFGLTPTCSLMESGINIFKQADSDCSSLPIEDLKKYCGCSSTEEEAEDDNTCTFCPGGEIVPDEHQYDFMRLALNSVPAPNGDENAITCKDARKMVEKEQRGSTICNDIQRGSSDCGCPVPDNTCELCPGGAVTQYTNRVDTIFGIKLVCGTYQGQLRSFDRDSVECLSVDKSSAEICGCKKNAEVVPCTFCPDGEAVQYPQKELVGFEGMGHDYTDDRTCGAVELALPVLDEDDRSCWTFRLLNKACGCSAPKTACSICQDGDTSSFGTREIQLAFGSVTEMLPEFTELVDINDRKFQCDFVDSFLSNVYDADDDFCYWNQLIRGSACGCRGTNHTRVAVLVWAQRFSGFLSLVGSVAIIVSVLKKTVRSRTSTYNQLVLSISVFDALSSMAYIFGTTLTPAALGLYGSIGTEETCKFQGWLFQVGITSIYYNVMLCVYFLLVVKYNWRESKFKRIIKWVHLGVLLVGISMSLAVIPFVTADWRWCYLNKPPINDSWLPGVFFFILPIGVCVLLMTALMILFVRYIRATETTSRRQSLRRIGEPKRRSLASRTFWQSLYFLAAFYTVWPIQFVAFLVPLVERNYWIYLLAAILGPLQGFLNATVVFYRDREALNSRAFTSCGIGTFMKSKIHSLFTAKHEAQEHRTSSGFRSWFERQMSSQIHMVNLSSEEQPTSLSNRDQKQPSYAVSRMVRQSVAEGNPKASQISTLDSIVDTPCEEPSLQDLEMYEENVAIVEFAMDAGLFNDMDHALYQGRISSLESASTVGANDGRSQRDGQFS